MGEKKKVLVLFSSGRDSKLCACKMVEDGYQATLIHFDNGCMAGLQYVQEAANQLIERYGPENVVWAGTHPIIRERNLLSQHLEYIPFQELGKTVPNIQINQLRCLICRLAMYASAIAYAKLNGITVVVDGARMCQRFAIEQQPFIGQFRELFACRNLEFKTPMLEYDDDQKLKQELMYRGIYPKAMETQCWIGQPMKADVSKEQMEDLVAYYTDVLAPVFGRVVEEAKDGHRVWKPGWTV